LTTPDQHHRTNIARPATAAADAIAFHAIDLAARGISISCTVDTDADVMAEGQALRQLLINLISDAMGRTNAGAHISIASRTTASTVDVLIAVSGTQSQPPMTDTFAALLARTLAELSGAQLTADPTHNQSQWQIAAQFTRAVQNDFFRA
jgi:hypothetical protein